MTSTCVSKSKKKVSLRMFPSLLPLPPAPASLSPPAGEAHEVHLQAAAVQAEGSRDRATAGTGHVPTLGGLATHSQPEIRAHRGKRQTCSIRDVKLCSFNDLKPTSLNHISCSRVGTQCMYFRIISSSQDHTNGT